MAPTFEGPLAGARDEVGDAVWGYQLYLVSGEVPFLSSLYASVVLMRVLGLES